MNNRLLILVGGELQRLTKYNITTISFLLAVIWSLFLYFIDDNGLLKQLLPMVLITDATLMSVLYIGSIMFFEKTESTISTLLVTPVTYHELIWSKAIANTLHTSFSSFLVVIAFYFIEGVNPQWGWLILGLFISVLFHSILGFIFAYHSKNFTSMLVNVMLYGFVFTIPSLLYLFHFLGEEWRFVLYFSPTQQASEIIQAAFSTEPLGTDFIIGYLYLFIVGIIGYVFYVFPKFKDYAIKQSGV